MLVPKQNKLVTNLLSTVTNLGNNNTSNKIFWVTPSPIGEWDAQQFGNNFLLIFEQELQQHLKNFIADQHVSSEKLSSQFEETHLTI